MNDETRQDEPMDWERARQHLEWIINEYRKIGPPGALGLLLGLYPLQIRLDCGERTRELYDEIMAGH